MAIRLEFKSNSKQAQKDISQLERSVKGIDDNVGKAAKGMNTLAKAAKIAGAAFAGIYIGKQLTGIVDSFTLVENRIALVTGRTAELKTTFDELNQISLRARGSLEGIADLYNRLGRTTKSLGVTNKEVLEVTETIQKAITISGASAASADAAIVQLGQGLAAGALRGQELNSVMEQTPRVASAIAAELGVGVGQLRKLAEQGKITSEVVVNAFKSQKGVIEAEFAAVDATVGQGFSQTAGGLKLVIREFIAATGVSGALANKLISMSKSLVAFAPNAKEAGIAMREFFVEPTGFRRFIETLSDLPAFFGELVSNMQEMKALRIAAILAPITAGFAKIKDVYEDISFTTLDEKIVSGVKSAASGVKKGIMNLVKAISDGFSDMMLKIRLSTAKFMAFTVYPIIHGIEILERAFYWLWDQVVGNSHWPDMIDGINSYTGNIWWSFKEIFRFNTAVESLFGKIKRGFLRQKDNLVSYFQDDLQDDIEITFSAIATLNPKIIAITAITFGLKLASSVVSALNEEFPRLGDQLASSLVQGIALAYGKIPFAIAAALGGMLASGLDITFFIDTVATVADVLGAGIGRALGGLIMGIPAIGVALTAAAFNFASALGEGILQQIPLIGGALSAIPLADPIFGILGLSLFGKAGWKLIRDPKVAFKTLMARIVAINAAVGSTKNGGLVAAILGNTGTGLLNQATDMVKNFGRAIIDLGKGKGLPRGAGLSGMVQPAALTAVQLFGERLRSINAESIKGIKIGKGRSAAMKLYIKDMWAGVAALYATIAGEIKLTAANFTLAGSWAIVSAAAEVAWTAMLGPFGVAGKLIKGLVFGVQKLFKSFGPLTKIAVGLVAVFGAMKAAASDSNGEMVRTKGILKGIVDNFVDSLTITDWSVELDIKDQSALESLEDIQDGADDLVYALRNVGSDSLFGSLGTDLSTFFFLNFEKIKGGLDNLGVDIRNWWGQMMADLRDDSTFVPEEQDFRTGAQKMLDEIDTGLYVDLRGIKQTDFDAFANSDDLAYIEALQRGVTELASEINDAQVGVDGFFLTDAELAEGKAELESMTEELKRLTAEVPRTIKAGAGLASLTKQFKNLKTSAKINDVFGDGTLAILKQGEVLALSAEDFNNYISLMNQAKVLAGKIDTVTASEDTDSEKRDQLAGIRTEISGINAEVAKLGAVADVFTSWDLADFVGIEGVDMLRATNEQLETATSYYKQLTDATAEYDAAVAAGDTEAAQLAQNRMEAANKAGADFGLQIQKGFMSELEKMEAVFGQAGISLSLEQFVKLGTDARDTVSGYVDSIANYQDELLAAIEDPDTSAIERDKLKLALADAIIDVGDDVAKLVEASTRDNFEKALKPFKDIGAAFSNEDFAKLGMKATQQALADAEILSKRFEEVRDKDFATKADMLAAIAQFNEDVIEFEEDLARRRKDAMFNETKAGEMASSFSELLMNSMKGEVDFAEGFTNLILDSIQNSLQEQITSFAKGFIETMLGGLDSAEAAGNGAAGAIKTMIFGPTEAQKEDLEKKGSGVAGALGLGTPLGTIADPIYTITSAGLEGATSLLSGMGSASDIAGTDATLDMVDELLGVTDGDRSVVEAVGGLEEVSKEGFGGLGGLLGNIFGGGGAGGGWMGAIGGIASMFGLFDNGGSIQPNKFGIVGERGPELVSGPATVYNRAKTARELEKAKGVGGGNVTFALEGDFDSRAERSIRNMVNSGMMQSALNGAEVENGGNQPIFRTP